MLPVLFIHGELEPGKNAYVEMHLGFSWYSKDGTRKVLKLNKTLYELWHNRDAQSLWIGTIQI